MAEYDQGTGALIREYVWLDWEPLAVIEGGTIFYVRADHIGRPVFATNASGAKVWTMSFDPFGTLIASTGNPIAARFPGQWFQAESGLHQNWMRDYNPTTGRYIQPDPLGLIDGSSVYGYAGQNPGRLTDPSGEQTLAPPSPLSPIRPAMSVMPGTPLGDALGHSASDGLQGLLDLSHNYNPIDLAIQWCVSEVSDYFWPPFTEMAPHTKNARPSSKAKHQKEDARRGKDRSGEKADDYRDPPRKAPPGHKGPWPKRPSSK